MHFTNATPFPALLHREAIPRDRIAAAAVLRATFDIGATGGPCRAGREQPWRVSKSGWEGPQGPMESDAFFDRDSCDLLLFGDAATADGAATESLDVSITVGDFSASVRVLGDRTWLREGERLIPSRPVPFTMMPLGLEWAYGGVALFDELPVPHAATRRAAVSTSNRSKPKAGRSPTSKTLSTSSRAGTSGPTPSVPVSAPSRSARVCDGAPSSAKGRSSAFAPASATSPSRGSSARRSRQALRSSCAAWARPSDSRSLQTPSSPRRASARSSTATRCALIRSVSSPRFGGSS